MLLLLYDRSLHIPDTNRLSSCLYQLHIIFSATCNSTFIEPDIKFQLNVAIVCTMPCWNYTVHDEITASIPGKRAALDIYSLTTQYSIRTNYFFNFEQMMQNTWKNVFALFTVVIRFFTVQSFSKCFLHYYYYLYLSSYFLLRLSHLLLFFARKAIVFGNITSI